MDVFDVLTLIGGLCLFLFGMNIMGSALERSAGSKLELMIGKLTTGRLAGLFTGLGVTAVIQSSSATTVMVVGFVNSRLMTLKQAIHVIMGANIGTTVTAWILSLSGISGSNMFLKLLKPSSFTPILALIGIALYMFTKSNKKRDIGMVLLGFATLMFGMETMTDAVSGLKNVPAFQELFIMFKNPILGVLVGAVLTAIIQSSSASVGILQALAATGAVSYGAAIPIIMGQNIGTCITAIISSVGTTKNAKRAALVHLSFNMIGTAVCLIAFSVVKMLFAPALLNEPASFAGIATAHSIFNVVCTFLLLPMSGLLERLAYKLIPDAKQPEKASELDERLLSTPAIALECAHNLTCHMAELATGALKNSMDCLSVYDKAKAKAIRDVEDKTDHLEDVIGSYLVKLSMKQLNEAEGAMASMLLKAIGDFERISDHAVNILESAEEMREKGIVFSAGAKAELQSLCDATAEIVGLSYHAFVDNNAEQAQLVEPLEQVIDRMKELLRTRHIDRLRAGECGIEAGFVWSDLITNMERVSDHCSNISGCVMDTKEQNMNLHESLKLLKSDNAFYREQYAAYTRKYLSFVS
ncbi:MAG: Na/Pi cotransporter family protein [Oscillospiraceae bacterium]|nr:Na/Pi cotransporter family protein [Oscillospiraceae bacterium]